MEKELATLQQDFNDQINEIQTKVSMTQHENKKQYSDFETKFQNLRGELSLVREYVDNQISEIQHDARTREVDAIEEGNRTSNSNSLPEIGTKLNKNAFEEAKKLQEEIEKEIAESESKIQRRNRMLQEDEDDEEEEDEELEENDQEEEVAGAEEENEPEESSFLESDEDDDANSPLSKDPAPGGGRNLPEGPDRDDDELSVNSSRSSSHSHHSMRETSRIEDSLDESMEVIESMKHTKPISGLMFEVDSLGNMVPIKRNNKEEPKIEINQPSTTSSGSLLGSGGRNKSVPIPRYLFFLKILLLIPSPLFPPPLLSLCLPSSNNVSIRSNSLPPPPAVVPLPAPNPSSTRHHHEDTAQCTFCLRRFNIEELKSHLKVCELRTELCKYGCRSRIMASKMEKHLEICPNNPNNKE